jgi:hypothetical protein
VPRRGTDARAVRARRAALVRAIVCRHEARLCPWHSLVSAVRGTDDTASWDQRSVSQPQDA